MQCQECKEHTATIHLTEISSGDRVETHLCELCAQKKGVAVKNQIPLNELLSNLLASQDQASPDAAPEQKLQDVKCPHCGMTLSKFQKTSLLGCPQDYEVFDKPLLPLIQKSHAGRTTHCGKVPARQPEDSKKQVELMELRRQLEDAVKAEDYETAAKLRDKIGQSE